MMVFGYLILIRIDFNHFISQFLPNFSVDWEDISNTQDSVFDHISKHLEVRQKYSAVRRIFNSLLGVKKCGQTQSFVFDILLVTQKINVPCCNRFPCEKSPGNILCVVILD